MADISWSRRAPGRGGVVDEVWCRNPEGGTLELEIRRDGSWLWIRDEDGECRVLAFPDTDLGAVFEKMSGIDDLPSVGNYLSYMSQLGLSLVAYEQFQHSFVNELPEPGDAGFFYFRDVLGEVASGNPQPEFHAKLGDPIPPSARAALELGFDQLWSRGVRSGPRPAVRWDVAEPVFPAPDQPRAHLDFALFRPSERGVEPCGPAAPPDSVDLVARIANTGYSVPEWAAEGAKLGPHFLPRWGELLAVMTHGAPIPQGRDPFTWIQRLQTAAALTLAGLDAGWHGSQRRRALIHLALGPVDWTVQAAIIALYHVAKNVPEAREEVEHLFHFLQGSAATRGYTCYTPALATLWLELGPKRIAPDVLRDWGRQGWEGGPRDVVFCAGMDLTGYAERRVAGGGPLDEWEARLARDPGLRQAFDRACARANVRAQLRHTDPASDAGMALIRAFT